MGITSSSTSSSHSKLSHLNPLISLYLLLHSFRYILFLLLSRIYHSSNDLFPQSFWFSFDYRLDNLGCKSSFCAFRCIQVPRSKVKSSTRRYSFIRSALRRCCC